MGKKVCLAQNSVWFSSLKQVLIVLLLAIFFSLDAPFCIVFCIFAGKLRKALKTIEQGR